MISCSLAKCLFSTSSLFKIKINSSLATWNSFLHFSSVSISFSSKVFLSKNKSLVLLILAFSLVNDLREICKLYNSFDNSSTVDLQSSFKRSDKFEVYT